MDIISSASKSRKLNLAVATALLLSILPFAHAQNSKASADLQYESGIALAKLGNLDEAREIFLKARAQSPTDPRFPTELGGVAFKQKKYDEAIHWLRIARRLNPSDPYTNDFLGTLFYLTGNLHAALNSWNRAGKPIVENVQTEPTPILDPVILDRAFAFAPGGTLTLPELLTTEARLRALGIFANFNLEVAAREDGKFDVILHAAERHGFGSNKWDALISTFGGAFAWGVTPRYYNIHGSATNLAVLGRFDPEKRRGTVTISGPLHRNPRWRYRVGGDFRNENWNVRNFSSIPGGQVGSLNLRRTAAGADIDSINSGRWSWSLGGEYSYRDFRSVTTAALPVSGLLLKGSQLKQRAQINYEFLRAPEHHLTIASSAWTQLGRLWADDGSYSFLKSQGSVLSDWFLSPKGDDLEMQQRISAGKTFGDVPFDELYVLGVDWDDQSARMRAHFATDRGRKGNAPLGRAYFVSNWEVDKKVYSNGLVRISLGPFVDTGRITDPLPSLGSAKWLWDTGPQAKLKAFGVQVVVVYGKDLRTGDNTVYAYVGR